MISNVTDKISHWVSRLPEDKQLEVLKFVEDIGQPRRSLLDIVREIEETIPDEVLEKLPVDGSINHDHYLYGARKK